MKYITVLVALFAGLLLSACAISGQSTGDTAATGIRTPKPTFTPTPVTSQTDAPAADPAIQSTPAPSEAQPPAGQAVPAPVEGDPRVVVTSPMVNLRLGPGTSYDIVGTVERGQEFNVVGRNPEGTWWFVCCNDDDYVWIFDELVDTDGPIDAVPITGGATEGAPAAVTPLPPTPAPAPVDQFNLVRQEQFAESGLVRIYLYVTDDTLGLAGYTARITKDGRQLPVEAETFGGQPAFTWPFQDARQRHQNFRIEFPDESPAGDWEIQLLNADGMVVGPVARFTLSADDTDQELYMRYERQ